MQKRIGKNDLIFLGTLLLVVLIVWFAAKISSRTESDTAGNVEITVDGEVYGTYPLRTDAEIPIVIDGVTTNLLVIRDGKADMTDADCPDKLCVHQRAISKTNETIVCLPNKVVAAVVGKEESEIDSIAK